MSNRSITFTIPAKLGLGVQVTVVENENGNLDFTVDVPGSGNHAADLRGLFFHLIDESDLGGLKILGGDGLITGIQIKANGVIDLGQGNNLHGAANPFDVGIAFGTPGKGKDFITGPVHFTLDATQPLTLDDIAHVLFGSRLNSVGDKLVFLAPAAPDAKDDTFGGAPNKIFEDGASGLDSPSTTAVPVTLAVLVNDTDADVGDVLTITGFDVNPSHGTVAIAADGNTALYTPTDDFSGTDSFVYIISDGHGGTDFATATVTLEAVADVPDFVVEKSPGDTVNQMKIKVTAKQTDNDGSEFIDRIAIDDLAKLQAAGVTVTPESVDPTTTDGTLTQTFVVTLPEDGNTNVALKVNAWSKETSNGDEQVGSVSIPLEYVHKTTTTSVDFTADNQSIWNTGSQFTFDNNSFLGIDSPTINESDSDDVTYSVGIDGHFKLGFQSKLHFEGGEIDAKSTYDVTVETSYNKTVDQLQIDTSKLLTNASFTTEGPEGTYALDFIYDILLHAFFDTAITPQLDVSIGKPSGTPGEITGPISGQVNVLTVDSNSLGGTFQIPGASAFSVTFNWPDIPTNGAGTTSPVVSSGASQNVLQLNLDLDQLIAQRLFPLIDPTPNPFDPPEFDLLDLGLVTIDLDYVDVDVNGGINFLQNFTMALGDLTGVLKFEDNSVQAFKIGDTVKIDQASLKDADHDGLVEFSFLAVPTAQLHNETDLGFNIGASLSLLTATKVDIPAVPNFSIGPLFSASGSLPVGSIDVFDNTFTLTNFVQQDELTFFT